MLRHGPNGSRARPETSRTGRILRAGDPSPPTRASDPTRRTPDPARLPGTNARDPGAPPEGERDDRASRLLQQRNQDPPCFILSALDTENTATGFKALYSSLSNPRWREVTHSLLAIPGIKFIHLTRHNSLRRFISEQIMVTEHMPVAEIQ